MATDDQWICQLRNNWGQISNLFTRTTFPITHIAKKLYEIILPIRQTIFSGLQKVTYYI